MLRYFLILIVLLTGSAPRHAWAQTTPAKPPVPAPAKAMPALPAALKTPAAAAVTAPDTARTTARADTMKVLAPAQIAEQAYQKGLASVQTKDFAAALVSFSEAIAAKPDLRAALRHARRHPLRAEGI